MHLAAILAFTIISSVSFGQNILAESILPESHKEVKEERTYNYQDSLNRDTPRGSLEGFFRACEDQDYETAANYLDLRGIPKSVRKEAGPKLAKKIKFVIERALDIDEMSLSDEANGVRKDGLATSRDLVGQIEINKRKYTMYMDRMWGPKAQVWKFSKSTVKSIDVLYEHFGNGVIGDMLPPAFVEIEILTLQLWQWIAIIIFFPIAFGISKLFTKWFLHILPRLGNSIDDFPSEKKLKDLSSPALLFSIVFCSLFLSLSLNLTLATQKAIMSVLTTLFVVSLTWFFLRSVDIFANLFQYKLERRGLYAASSMVPLGRRFIKIFLFVITALALLRVYNVDITALLAGLGVGGIAVALAAQKSLENLFSGVALITDQPVRVGDFCRFDQQLGRVEDIGLRSTRIRTLNRSVITIPNREFSQMKLENLSMRDKIPFKTLVGVRYETTPDQMRLILSELRKLLLSHPKVLQDDRIRVRLVEFNNYSLDIEVFGHINTEKWYDFLAIREDIMLRIMEIVERCGSSFAFPSKTVYQEPGHGLPQDKVQQAEHAIEELRQAGELPFPDYSQKQYSQFRSKLSYPPEGSVSKPK